MTFTALLLSVGYGLNYPAAIAVPSYGAVAFNAQLSPPPAIEISPSMVKAEFTSAKSLYESGVNFHQGNQFLEAIAAYEQAINLDPTLDVAFINLGLAYIQLEQFDLATTVLDQALTLPDRPEVPASIHSLAHYNLAIIHNREGDFDQAIVHTTQALTLAPEFTLAQELLKQLEE